MHSVSPCVVGEDARQRHFAPTDGAWAEANGGRNWGLPADKFFVQGSTLRQSNAALIGDIDIALIVSESEFNSLVSRFKGNLINNNGYKVGEIVKDASKGKINGINMYLSLGSDKSFSGEFYSNFQNTYNATFQQHFNVPKIQISIIKQGGEFDISPFLKI